METLKFNNQPKVEIEKTPQENEGLLNEQEQESGKRENIVLEIDGQKIEAVKYYFDYPERIQKETGILGYERIKILNNSFKRIEHAGVNDILSQLSNGEYPNYTYNHMMGGFVDTQKERDNMNKDFKDDKFFLQKIYDVSRIEKKSIKGYEKERIFNYPPRLDKDDSYHSFPTSIFNLINNDDDLAQVDNSPKHIGKIIDYKDNIEDGQYFALTQLNVAVGDFWHGIWGEKKEKLTGFGFPVFGESYFHNYIKESLSIRLKIKKEKDFWKILNDYYLGPLFGMYLMSEYQKEGNSTNKKDWDKELFLKATLNITENFLKEYNINYEPEYLDKGLMYFFLNFFFYQEESFLNNFRLGGGYDFQLPIFIGHPEIPQLSWGHAKYAHYKNDKSFNFFKFKHADHLLVKEEVASSDS